MNQTKKVAIVTGASRGIGRAIASRLASDGFAVVVNYAGNAAEAKKVVNEISAAGGQAAAVQADVSKTADVARLFEQAVKQFGGVDVLVNNAGVLDMKTLSDMPDETFDRIFAINVRGTFNTMKVAIKVLRNGGRIINFSSSIVGLSPPTYGPYAASKAAVEALTRIAAKELRGKNITVNAVAPGPTATDMFVDGKTPEQIENFRKMPPLERLGTPEDIANVVSFVAGKDAGWINGQTIRANGGIA